MNNTTENNLLFINMDTVTNVWIWREQLTARLADMRASVKVGDIVIALRNGSAMAVGRITARGTVESNGYLSRVWVRMNLGQKHMPIPLSEKQKAVLKATAQENGCAYPGFDSALVIPLADAAHFSKFSTKIYGEESQASSPKKGKRNQQLLFTMRRTDITDVAKVSLCNALLARGDLADAIFHRDQRRIDTDHELDLVPTRIVPWECCTDFERTDPNNYILLDVQLADHFEVGLISFFKNGNQIQDPAMDEDAFDPWVDRYFTLPKLNKDQKKYMDWHREHVFKQWRSDRSKPLYVQDE